MSNYKPGNYQIWNNRIKDGILRLMERRIYEVNNKFPLTIRELQQALVSPATLSLINTLEAEYGLTNIPTYDSVWFKLPEDPQLPRSAVVHCEGRPGEFEMYMLEKPRVHNGWNVPTINLYCPLEEKEERMTQLYNWVNLAVTERRHRNLVSATVDEFLQRYADTLWHVMVRWPVLKLGFDSDTRERAQTAPRNPEHYGWGGPTTCPDWYSQNREVMKFIDRLLLEASLLPIPIRRPGMHASIQTWKRLGEEAY